MASGFTTTTSLTELVPEITREVDTIYQNASIGRQLVNYQDVTGERGTIFEFPELTEVVASTGVGETAAPTSHQLDITMPYLTIARKSVYVGPGDLAMKASNITPAAIARAMVKAQDKEIDTIIFGVTVGTTNFATSAGSTDQSMSISYALAGLVLLEKNEIDEIPNAVMHPQQYQYIRTGLTPVANDDAISVSIADVMSRDAYVGRAFGMNWFNTNRVSSGTVDTTDDVYNGLIFAPSAIGYCFSWLYENGIESVRDPVTAVTKLVLNWADSAGVIKASGVCEVNSV